MLADISRAEIRAFAGSLQGKPGAVKAVLVHVRALLLWCEREGLIDRSPMRGLAMPKDNREPTQPLTRDEVRRLLKAARPGRERALLMLMRWSGFAIADATAMRPENLRAGAAVIYRRKTQSLCCVPLPQCVIDAIDALPVNGAGYWFWTGKGEWVTCAKTWRDRLKAVARQAGVEGFHPHRLRDTFAVELLLDGVAIEDVARLLGHSSVQITEKYYAPWNRARLARLDAIVRAAHDRDQILAEVSAWA